MQTRFRPPRPQHLRRVAVLTAAGMLTLGAISAPVGATPQLPLDHSGGVVGWGSADKTGAWTVPDSVNSSPVAAVAANVNSSLILSTTGQVTSLSTLPTLDLPDALKNVTARAIAVGATDAALVTTDGKVDLWGDDAVPAAPDSLTNVKDVAIGQNFGVALKQDGTVAAWGDDTKGQTDVPTGLDHVTAIAAGYQHAYALKDDGTVAAWGDDTNKEATLPAVLTDTTDDIDVTAVAARNTGGLALLSDGTVVSWGFATTVGIPPMPTQDPPSSLVGKHIVAISAAANSNTVLDSDGNLTTWAMSTQDRISAMQTVPADLDGKSISSLATSDGVVLAVEKKTMIASAPSIAGTATVGLTLTGTPGTFSGTPDSVANQWLANGTAIAGATGTTYKLTQAELGKTISFRSTATTGSVSIDSTSASTAAVKPAPVAAKVASKTAITKITSAKHGKKVTITVKVTAKKRPTGKIAIVIKARKKTAYKGKVTLNSKGIATLHANNKKALTKHGKYTVTATYAGNAMTKPSKAVKSYRNH